MRAADLFELAWEVGLFRAVRGLWRRLAAALRRHRLTIHRLREALARHHDQLQADPRQLDGEDVDVDALIDTWAERRSGHAGSPRVHLRFPRVRRDLAVMLLLDVSLSSDAWAEDRRVLDVTREAALVLGEVTDGFGDALSAAGFASSTRNRCRVWTIMDWDDPWATARHRLGALTPQGYTRIGAAVRHATASDAFSRALAGGYEGLAAIGRLAPQADPAWHGLERVEGVPHGPLPEQALDVYRPVDRPGLLPGLLYLHGGGFRAMSRQTHWLLGLAYARRGMVVFLADYRLGRSNPYPVPAEDACAAWAWVAEHAEAWGADPARLGVAGESAGANLAAMVGVASAWSRPAPFARRVYDAPARPRVALPACGILQGTDSARFHRRKRLLPPVRLVIEDVERVYLPGGPDAEVSLADPLGVVESAAPDREPPAFFLPVGTRDPLLDDTRRMARALRARGAVAEDRYYPGEVHAFHAFVWRAAARRCWRETYAFLDRHLGGGSG